MEFYQNAGFTIKQKLMDYYTDLDPPHCYIYEKDISSIKGTYEDYGV